MVLLVRILHKSMNSFKGFRRYYGKAVIKAFDKWSLSYDSNVAPKLERRGYSYETLAKEIISRLGINGDSRVAELGCGSGILGEHVFRQSKSQIHALDISSGMLKEARNKAIYELLYNATAEDLPFANDSFDAIYSTFMFHSVLDQEKALQEIYRILKPGAKAVIVDLCPPESKSTFWTLVMGNIHSFKHEHGALSKYRTVSKLSQMVKNQRFEVTDTVQLGKNKTYTHFLINFQKNE